MTSTALSTPGADVAADDAIRAPGRGRYSVAGLVAAGLAALAVLGVCAWLGVVKFDEGWYIVSARLVGHGALPYRDFAFTQGPLFPYVIAPSQWIAPGVM